MLLLRQLNNLNDKRRLYDCRSNKTAPQSKAYYGIDLSPKTIERAKENLAGIEDVNLICGDFLTYEFDRTFDIVYSSLTFMHIKEKQAAIGKAACLLSENGRFVLSIEKSQATLLEYGKRKIEIYSTHAFPSEKHVKTRGIFSGFFKKECLYAATWNSF